MHPKKGPIWENKCLLNCPPGLVQVWPVRRELVDKDKALSILVRATLRKLGGVSFAGLRLDEEALDGVVRREGQIHVGPQVLHVWTAGRDQPLRAHEGLAAQALEGRGHDVPVLGPNSI